MVVQSYNSSKTRTFCWGRVSSSDKLSQIRCQSCPIAEPQRNPLRSLGQLSYLKFLDDLLHTGEVRLESELVPTEDELSRGTELLVDFERTWRMDLPSNVPPYSPAAGTWAAKMLFRAAQLLMFRDIPATEVERSFTDPPPPDDQSLESHYSVDLTFRFLPDLTNFSQAVATDDPLSIQLQRWCHQWPISSVGVRAWKNQHAESNQTNADASTSDASEDDCQLNLTGFIDDPCLLQIYVDRILSRKDRSRINHPKIINEIKRIAGAHPDLTASLGPLLTLEKETNEEPN